MDGGRASSLLFLTSEVSLLVLTSEKKRKRKRGGEERRKKTISLLRTSFRLILISDAAYPRSPRKNPWKSPDITGETTIPGRENIFVMPLTAALQTPRS